MIRDDPSWSELIRPGLAVRVDPVRLLYLPLNYCEQVLLKLLFSNSLWNSSNFSQIKSESQGVFKSAIEDVTLTYQLISLKQLDNVYGKCKSSDRFLLQVNTAGKRRWFVILSKRILFSSVFAIFAGSCADRIHTEVNCQVVVSDFVYIVTVVWPVTCKRNLSQKFLCKQSRLPQLGSSLQCESYRQNFQRKLRRLNWTKFFSIKQRIKGFFPLCLPFCNSSKH